MTDRFEEIWEFRSHYITGRYPTWGRRQLELASTYTAWWEVW